MILVEHCGSEGGVRKEAPALPPAGFHRLFEAEIEGFQIETVAADQASALARAGLGATV
jgi:hypothetical protein